MNKFHSIRYVAILCLISFLSVNCGDDSGGGDSWDDSDEVVAVAIDVENNTSLPKATMSGGSLWVGHVITKFDSSQEGDYVISLTNASTNIMWTLWPDRSYEGLPILDCDNNGDGDNTNDEICNVTLDANTTYYLHLINMGTEITPSTLYIASP